YAAAGGGRLSLHHPDIDRRIDRDVRPAGIAMAAANIGHEVVMTNHSNTKSGAARLPNGPLADTPLALTLREQLAQRSALLVIDMQNDFTSDQGLLAQRGRDPMLARGIIDQVNALVEGARKADKLIVWVETAHSCQDALPNYLSVH